jgi:hypothetical protein
MKMNRQQSVVLRLLQPGGRDHGWKLMKQLGGVWNLYEDLRSLDIVEMVRWLVSLEKRVRLWGAGFWSIG